MHISEDEGSISIEGVTGGHEKQTLDRAFIVFDCHMHYGVIRLGGRTVRKQVVPPGALSRGVSCRLQHKYKRMRDLDDDE